MEAGHAMPVGGLACQRDSFLWELHTDVLSCESETTGRWAVVLQDTVLFPEGGGQPSDTGTIDGIKVLDVQRKGAHAVHFLAGPLSPRKGVVVQVDRKRRMDHMQQHSAQHLLTALAEAEFGFHTESWHMGEKMSYIQMDTPAITAEQLGELENKANDHIFAQVPVTVFTSDDAVHDPRIRQRRLPVDLVGPVRVVEIAGIDQNLCCGTHVAHLGQLQAIKLLHSDPKKGSSQVHFVAGGRVLETFGAMLERERAMAKLFSGLPPEKHATTVDVLRKDVAKLTKANRSQSLELAEFIAKDMAATINPEEFVGVAFFFHRDDASIDFLTVLADRLLQAHPTLLVVSTCGVPRENDLQFLVSGPAAAVQEVGPRVASLLGGKGGGSAGKFRGKATDGKAITSLSKRLFANAAP
eukprot:GGOE01040629.1.p1 GENE.GGOE01040629.1~~GGOE01040629.1.p1  ORF type:complete len:419 (+),score=130.17 GGOE01040629.1:26-1258(+)